MQITRVLRTLSFSAIAAAQLATSVSAQAPAQTVASATESTVASTSRSNYRIGPGDVIELRVLGEEQMSSTGIRVSGDGFVQVPFVDEDLRAQCLTERELGELIASKLKKYLKYPEVHVAVKEFNSIPVAIIGAVNQPGRFQLQRRVSLLELVTFAGGVKTDTAGKVIHLIHTAPAVSCEVGGGVVDPNTTDEPETLSLKKLLEGDESSNRPVRPGDILVVPNADTIFVAGEVLKPSAFNLREGMTLTQALALAGGPTRLAKTGSIHIVRTEPGKARTEIPIDIKAIQANKADDPLLVANDVVEVPNSGGKTFFSNFFGALGGTVANLPIRAVP